MNKILQDYARLQIKKFLSQCTESQQFLFKRMYSHKNLTLDIDKVVDNMPEEKLDWALNQCQRTVDHKT